MGFWFRSLAGVVTEVTAPSREFWASRKVLVTGHTGFKGAWLSLYLSELGSQVHGLALEPITTKNLYSELNLPDRLASDSQVDLRDYRPVHDLLERIQPDVILHLAAQAIVSEGYRFPLDTLATNVMGTANLLEATRQLGLQTVVISVATDKVYRNNGPKKPFVEDDSLGGLDPYSASKAAADIVSQMFATSYLGQLGIPVGIARAGNVIGGGDWSKDRLFPDLARAWACNQPLKLRYPKATRPWQHVLEPLRGYLLLAEKLTTQPEMSGPFNFGPEVEDSLPVETVVNVASSFWPGSPGWLAEPEERFYETKDLAINNRRAKELLGVSPIWDSKTAIKRTTSWYHEYYSGVSAEQLCIDDIEAYGAQI